MLLLIPPPLCRASWNDPRAEPVVYGLRLRFSSPKYFCSQVTSFYFMAVCPFSFLYLSFILPLSDFLIFKINEQDIQFQEQLGHGNGGTVYKWVLFTSSLPWSLIGLIVHFSLPCPFHFITLEWSHYEYCVFEAKDINCILLSYVFHLSYTPHSLNTLVSTQPIQNLWRAAVPGMIIYFYKVKVAKCEEYWFFFGTKE